MRNYLGHAGGISRRSFLAGAAAVTGVALSPLPAVAAPRPARMSTSASLTLPQPPSDGVNRAQIFDQDVDDPTVYEGNRVYFVWGSIPAHFAAVPPPAVPSSYAVLTTSNWVSANGFDLAWYQDHHPDWIVYRGDRQTPAWAGASNHRLTPLDFTNPEVRDFYYDNFLTDRINMGYPMMAFDHSTIFNTSHCAGHFDLDGQWVQQFDPDEWGQGEYAAAVIDWLAYLTNRLHGDGVGSSANISFDTTQTDLSNVRAAMESVDVSVNEAGFTAHRDTEYTDEYWRHKFDLLRSLPDDHIHVSINQTTTKHLSDASPAQVNWVIANYLLCRTGGTLLALTGHTEYRAFLDNPKLHTNIGVALADPSQDASGAWTRPYTQGWTLVNPSSTEAAVVTLPFGVWHDLDDNIIWSCPGHNQMTLEPITGTVLTRGRYRGRGR